MSTKPYVVALLLLGGSASVFAGSEFDVSFGSPNIDVPVPGDYDGDGKAELAVYRKTSGEWIMRQASGQIKRVRWGAPGDEPIPSDYDGDGKIDPAVLRRWSCEWIIAGSKQGVMRFVFGKPTDLMFAGDFDGDGKADALLLDAGQLWRIKGSLGIEHKLRVFGAWDNRCATLADFDGDGRVDPGFLDGYYGWSYWSTVRGYQVDDHDSYGDRDAVSADYDGDGLADPANGARSFFYCYRTSLQDFSYPKLTGYSAITGKDYDGNGTADMTMYCAATGRWRIRYMGRYAKALLEVKEPPAVVGGHRFSVIAEFTEDIDEDSLQLRYGGSTPLAGRTWTKIAPRKYRVEYETRAVTRPIATDMDFYYRGAAQYVPVTVLPGPAIETIYFAAPFKAGSQAVGTIRLTWPAPPGGALVGLSQWGNAKLTYLDREVFVPAGELEANFVCAAPESFESYSGEILADWGTARYRGTFQVERNLVISTTPARFSVFTVKGGTTVQVRVAISGLSGPRTVGIRSQGGYLGLPVSLTFTPASWTRVFDVHVAPVQERTYDSLTIIDGTSEHWLLQFTIEP